MSTHLIGLVVFKYIGNGSEALDSVQKNTEPETYYGSFMVASSKSWDSGWLLQQTQELICVMKARG